MQKVQRMQEMQNMKKTQKSDEYSICKEKFCRDCLESPKNQDCHDFQDCRYYRDCKFCKEGNKINNAVNETNAKDVEKVRSRKKAKNAK